MFGFRTPAKGQKATSVSPKIQSKAETTGSPPQERDTRQTTAENISQTSNVRRSIGEWESGGLDSKAPTKEAAPVDPLKARPKKTLSQESRTATRRASVEAAGSPPAQPKAKYVDRLSEARACVTKAKLHLGNSRNIKTEIKVEVTQAIERLYQLVKETETVKGKKKPEEKEKEPEKQEKQEKEREKGREESELAKRMEEYAKLIEENNKKMDKLTETIERHQETQEKLSYADVTAIHSRRQLPEQTALHSVIVTGKDETETGEEILNRIREAINAKEGGITVEKIRKAKDRKVIVGCRTEQERQEIKDRLKKAEQHLNVQEVQNKDPLVILKDVFQYNSDTEILEALWNQNKKVLKDLDREKNKVDILYKKRTRNLQTHHVVMRVSPMVWQRLVEAETVMVDLQRVRVADQSPLVQCSLCLGYGHGRRFCKETVEKCCHCGGPHVKAECADWLAGAAPSCCNCVHAKLARVDHNAFSSECVIRRKWDTLARATIGYHC